jgi:hypothetical protein
MKQLREFENCPFGEKGAMCILDLQITAIAK